MSIDLKLGSDYDLVIESGDLQLVTESEEVAQSTKIRLLFWQGEWILNYTKGVPWLDKIFSVSVSQEEKDAIIKKAILETPHVLELLNYEFGMDYAAHGAQITFEATTDFGNIVVEVVT